MVKVIIERRVKPGSEAKVEELLTEMRSQAMYHSRGFVSGEVLMRWMTPQSGSS